MEQAEHVEGDRSLAHVLIAAGLPAFAALVVAKALAFGTWRWGDRHVPVQLGLLALGDLEFVLGWVLVAIPVLALARRGRFDRWARRGFLALSAVVVLFGLVNVWVYSALRMPLTYPLLTMAGEGVGSSIRPYLNAFSVTALVAGPILYLLAAGWLLRARWPGSQRTHVTLALLILIYWPIASYGNARWFAGGPNEGLARSPHWAFIVSTIDHWRGESSVATDAVAIPDSYRAEFLPAGMRPAGNAGGSHPRVPKVKNVIFVVLESTGTQFLGVYGAAYPTTPCLKAETHNSLIFRNVYSNAGYTLHSMLPLVLSVYPGLGWTTYSVTHPDLRGTSAASALRVRGYRTAFLTGAVLGFRDSRRFFEGRGFDLLWGAEDFLRAGSGTMVSSWGIDDPTVFDKLLDWIGQEPDRPFFAMLWSQQSHHPYALTSGQRRVSFLAGPLDDRSRLLDGYLNTLRVADGQLGRLFDFLRQHHLDDSTLVVITGDHGEAFGFPHRWTFHGTSLYQESVNVPCILWCPKLFAPGGRSDVVGAHIDLNPTIFDLLGLPCPPAWQGTSLFDPSRAQRAYFSCNTGNLLEGMRDGSEEFIYNLSLDRQELYDLARDPDEQHNIAGLHPEQCRECRLRLSAWAQFQRAHLETLISSNNR